MKKTLTLTLFPALFTIATTLAAPVELKLNWQKGAVYTLSTTSDQVIEQTIGGRENTISQTVTMNYTFSVHDIDESGAAKIGIVYDSVKMEQTRAAGSFSYDSTNSESPVPAPAKPFAGLVGRGFQMTMTPAGKVSDIQGVNEMIDSLVASMDGQNAAMKEQMRESFKRQFGEKAIRENMQNMMGFFPENPVEVGDSWQNTMLLTTAMPVKIDATWKLTERLGDGRVRIDMDSVVTPLEDAAPMEMGPMKLHYELSGEQTGHLILDEVTGWIEESQIHQSFSGNIRVLNMPGAEDDTTTWPLSITGTLRTQSTRQK